MIVAPKVKLSKRNRRVLAVLCTDATNLSMFTLCRTTGAGAGSLYVFLARLEDAGLVAGEWEQRTFPGYDRPRRRFYRLTPAGWVWAWDVLGLDPPEIRRG